METIVKRIDHLMQFMMHVKKVKKSRAKYCTSKSLLKNALMRTRPGYSTLRMIRCSLLEARRLAWKFHSRDLKNKVAYISVQLAFPGVWSSGDRVITAVIATSELFA